MRRIGRMLGQLQTANSKLNGNYITVTTALCGSAASELYWRTLKQQLLARQSGREFIR